MIIRFLLALAALAALLVVLWATGLLADSQVADAEQQLLLRSEQQLVLARSAAASAQEHTAVHAYLDGDKGAQTSAQNWRAELDSLTADFRRLFAQDPGAADYTQLVGRFNDGARAVVRAVDAGNATSARAAARSLDGVFNSLTTTQTRLLQHSIQDWAASQQGLDDARTRANAERAIATALGLLLLLVLLVINLRYQGRVLSALARQARYALRAPPQAMPEFAMDRTAPRPARDLVDNLNSLVAQLREKYLELERANVGLHELNEEARSASQAKTAFVASISHELRTPLNTILGFSEMLLGEMYGPLTPRQRIQIERIMRNGQQLLTLINDVLDISRVEAGKVSLNLEGIDVAQLVGGVVAIMEPLARQKGLAFQIEVPPHLPPIVSDENRLRQILLNLLSNAVKFTRQGTVTLWVGFDPLLPTWMLFKVRDTGIGIPAAELDRIWQEFYQVSHGLSRIAGGSGLGLAIVRKLVELLGGDVDVKSVEGDGSTFTVYMPLQPAATRDGSAGASLFAATGSYSGPRKI